MLRILFISVVMGFVLGSCRGCTEQHDPRADWAKFRNEREHANKPIPQLTAEGKIPSQTAASTLADTADPIDTKYSQLCGSCHGENGDGNGAAAAALSPKPRDFTSWNDPKATSEYISKVIKDGGVAVGLSPLMAAWGGMLSAAELSGLVKKVQSFKK